MHSSSALHEIITHFGGDARLSELGIRALITDEAHVGFRFLRPNSKGVRSANISFEPGGTCSVDCFGRLEPGAFRAPIVASANGLLLENLPSALGALTGIESLQQRHF
jgi:hypothetical protein